MNILPQEETTVVVLGCRVKNKKPSLALKERLDKTYQYLNENYICLFPYLFKSSQMSE